MHFKCIKMNTTSSTVQYCIAHVAHTSGQYVSEMSVDSSKKRGSLVGKQILPAVLTQGKEVKQGKNYLNYYEKRTELDDGF